MGSTNAPPARRGSRTVLALVAVLLAALAAAPQGALAQAPGEDKALGRPATASSVELEPSSHPSCRAGNCVPGNATDGDSLTRWASAFAEGQFWQVDLGSARLVDTVAIEWQFGYARQYDISTSLDGAAFTPAASVTLPGGLRDHFVVRAGFAVRAARYVRVTSVRRATRYGISFYTVNVFGPVDPPPAPAVPAGSASVTPPAPPAATVPGSTGTGGPAGAPAAGPPPAAPAPTVLRPLQDATVRLRGTATSTATTIELLSVRAPRQARVRVRCKGKGCPRSVPTRRGSGRIRQLHRRLGVGAVIEIFVTQPGTTGKYTRFVIRSRKAPLRQDRCVLRGAPARCPAA